MPAHERPTREWIVAEPLALALTWKKDRVTDMQLTWSQEAPEAAAQGPRTDVGKELQKALAAYVQGEKTAWPKLNLAMEHLPVFHRQVLDALVSVEPGRVVTYGELAAMAGRPGAARAVGQAMAKNPFPLLVPCHRVVGSGGKLTGFSGAGLEMKAYLLDLEGARPRAAAPAD
jgi:methylated-DNA-[protein]-cysteine S-methyltransferase